jgi:hypothetical protein
MSSLAERDSERLVRELKDEIEYLDVELTCTSYLVKIQRPLS